MAGTSAPLEWHFVNMIYCKNYVICNRTIILFTLPPIGTRFNKSVNYFPHMSKNPQLAFFLLAIRRFHLEVVRLTCNGLKCKYSIIIEEGNCLTSN